MPGVTRTTIRSQMPSEVGDENRTALGEKSYGRCTLCRNILWPGVGYENSKIRRCRACHRWEVAENRRVKREFYRDKNWYHA